MSTKPSKIRKVSETEQWKMKLLIYGEPKVGKTTFCSTARGLGEVLILAAEKGLASIKDTDVDFWEVETTEDLNEALNFLSSEEHSYQTVCLDSLTEIQRIIIDDVTSDSGVPSQREWGIVRERIIRMVRYFNDLEMNVIVTCLPALVDDEIMAPEVVGKLKRQISAFFDEVGYMFVSSSATFGDIVDEGGDSGHSISEGGEPTRLILFHSHPRYIAGDRGGKLSRVELPNFTHIFEKTFGETEKPKKKTKPKRRK